MNPVYVLLGSRHDQPIAILATREQALEWLPADIESLPLPGNTDIPGLPYREFCQQWYCHRTGEFFRLLAYNVWQAADKV